MRHPYLAAGFAAALVLTLAGPATAAPAEPAPIGHQHHTDGDVRAIVHHSDGTSTMTIWSPADGVGAQGLYQHLKAAGTPGLIDPAAAQRNATLAEPVDCNIQGAYALNRLCGINRYHWIGTHPAVYFLDHTGADWPVYEAVVKWNESTAIDSGYRYSYSCPSSAHCVDVYENDYGDTHWVGATSYTMSGLNIIAAVIQLNDHRGPTYMAADDTHWHRETACHEEGHALGLDHNLFSSSCLNVPHTANRSLYPGPGDWLMLDSIY